MATVVIEHVAVEELPAAWRARLPAAPNARVTVRIEAETDEQEVVALADNPMFGMWQDRGEAADVPAIRASLTEGEASGEQGPFDAAGFRQRMLNAHG